MLGLEAFGPVTDTDTTKAPYSGTRQLVTNADVDKKPDRAHNAVIPGKQSVKNKDGKYLYEPVWFYLFNQAIE
jgi:hypothetical protein